MIVPVMAISKLVLTHSRQPRARRFLVTWLGLSRGALGTRMVLTRQIYSEETNGAHAHNRDRVPLKFLS